MNKKRFAALLTVLSLLLCGCNTTTVTPDITSDGSPTSESRIISESEGSSEDNSEDPTILSEETTSHVIESTTDTESEEKTQDTADSETQDSADTTDTEAETDDESTDESAVQSTTQTIVETVAASSATSATTAKTQVTTTAAPTQAATEPPATTTAVPAEPSPATVLTPVADGILTSGNKLATVDYSHTSDGYVMAKYTGSSGQIKVQITGPTGVTQTYNLNSNGRFDSYPLTASNGSYTINILESVGGGGYAIAHSFTFDVNLSSSLAPFLRPSQYVNYSSGDSAVTLASQLCAGTTTPLEKVDRIYSWLVDNVVYDYDLANSNIPGGYAGDTEKVIKQKKGICLDYAATMAAMLRSQNVPTQVISGDVSGGGFHAWVNVYVQDVGWVYGAAIYFDGSAWHRMDPTYAASSKSSKAILEFIANGNNYFQEFVF
ncbi:MAG: transglutaminase domain-containing protein [Ruminococcaceae bacterium]|nr:transglutaminase domain-containing protein [Oscillospiraceae bacterium]